MMRSKRYSKNSARPGLLLNTLIALSLILGCSSSTKPTFTQEEIHNAVRDICKKEYGIELTSRLAGKTLWVYMPAEDIFVPPDKPKNSNERFQVEQDDCAFKDDVLILQYNIKLIPEKEIPQEMEFNKQVSEKTNQVWSVIRRVLFSMDRSKSAEPEFICFVVGDIKNGYEIRQTSYYLDLKKISYNYISTEEYQHRAIQDIGALAEIKGDRDGSYIDYKDMTLKDFIARQIQYRIKLKFQKPEVARNANIDREVEKAVSSTIEIYALKDFDGVELDNLADNNKTFLSVRAIWDRVTK